MHKADSLTERWCSEHLSEWFQHIANQQLFQQNLEKPLQKNSFAVKFLSRLLRIILITCLETEQHEVSNLYFFNVYSNNHIYAFLWSWKNFFMWMWHLQCNFPVSPLCMKTRHLENRQETVLLSFVLWNKSKETHETNIVFVLICGFESGLKYLLKWKQHNAFVFLMRFKYNFQPHTSL